MQFTLDKDGLRQGLAMSTVMMAAIVVYSVFSSPYRFWAVMGALMFIQQRYNDPFRIRLPILLYSGVGALFVVAPFALLGRLSWWWFAGGLGLLAFVGTWLGGIWRPWQGVTTSVLLVALFAGALTPMLLPPGTQFNVLALEFWLLLGIGLAILFAWIWDSLIPRRNFPLQALLVFQEIQASLRFAELFFLGQDPSTAANRAHAVSSALKHAEKATIYTRVAELTADLPINPKQGAQGTCPLATSTLRMGRWLTTLTEALERIPERSLVERAVPGAGALVRTTMEGVGRIVERLEKTDRHGRVLDGGGGGWEAADSLTEEASRRSLAMELIHNDELSQMDWSAALAVVEVAFCLEQLALDLRKAEQRLQEVLP